MDDECGLRKFKLTIAQIIPQLTIDQYVGKHGQSVCDDLMGSLGWIMFRSEEADLKKVDRVYQLGCAAIYVQIKSANLTTEGTYRRWHWNIFDPKKGLPVEFYKEKDSFLVLVGLDIHEVYTETPLTIMGERVKEFVEAKKPKVGLIPGSKVIEHFEGKSEKTHNITLKENSISQWDRYFSHENIRYLLLEEFKRQTSLRKAAMRVQAKALNR